MIEIVIPIASLIILAIIFGILTGNHSSKKPFGE